MYWEFDGCLKGFLDSGGVVILEDGIIRFYGQEYIETTAAELEEIVLKVKQESEEASIRSASFSVPLLPTNPEHDDLVDRLVETATTSDAISKTNKLSATSREKIIIFLHDRAKLWRECTVEYSKGRLTQYKIITTARCEAKREECLEIAARLEEDDWNTTEDVLTR